MRGKAGGNARGKGGAGLSTCVSIGERVPRLAQKRCLRTQGRILSRLLPLPWGEGQLWIPSLPPPGLLPFLDPLTRCKEREGGQVSHSCAGSFPGAPELGQGN